MFFPYGRCGRASSGGRGTQLGFTLIELMVAIAVLAILVSVATPSFTSVINGNRLTGQANSLMADIQLARSEALRRNRSVRLCRSADGASCAGDAGDWSNWLVVLPNTNPLEVLRSGTAKAPLKLSAGVANVDFRADGLAHNSTGGLLATAFTVCIPTNHPADNVRTVSLDGGSRVRTTATAYSTPGSCP